MNKNVSQKEKQWFDLYYKKNCCKIFGLTKNMFDFDVLSCTRNE